MTKEQQNENWKRLTKDFREEVKKQYNSLENFDVHEAEVYRNIFGRENLMSDSEVCGKQFAGQCPPKFNIGEKVMVKNMGVGTVTGFKDGRYDVDMGGGKGLWRNESDIEPYNKREDVCFKYRIGDLVTYNGKVRKILNHSIKTDGIIMYTASMTNGQSPLVFEESELNPYTETDKEKIKCERCEAIANQAADEVREVLKQFLEIFLE